MVRTQHHPHHRHHYQQLYANIILNPNLLGESLVTLVVPASLLDMSRGILRSVFSHVIPKRIYTMTFERSFLGDTLHQKLSDARKNKSVVCTTPESVKSLMLKFVDVL